MERFNNIYVYCSCIDRKHIPKEIEKMYYDKYGKSVKKKFIREIHQS